MIERAVTLPRPRAQIGPRWSPLRMHGAWEAMRRICKPLNCKVLQDLIRFVRDEEAAGSNPVTPT